MLFCEHYKNIPFESKGYLISTCYPAPMILQELFLILLCNLQSVHIQRRFWLALRHPLDAALVTGFSLSIWDSVSYRVYIPERYIMDGKDLFESFMLPNARRDKSNWFLLGAAQVTGFNARREGSVFYRVHI